MSKTKLTRSRRSVAARTIACLCSMVLAGAVGTAAKAAVITYAPPTINGANVTFPAVSESSGTNTPPLYGNPTVSGNNLVFTNMSFNATSINGSPAIAFVDGQINATVMAKPGNTISSFNLFENGDYNVSATIANPAAINFVKLFPQAVQITVLAENGVPLATPLVNNTSVTMAYSPSNGDFQTGVDPSVGSWSGVASADLTALFGKNDITEIAFSFDNQLEAISQTGGIASISKKGFTFNPTLGAVPEPTSMGLMFGAVALGMARRRRSR